MSFPNSPGVYGREIIRDVTASPQIGFTGGAVIAAKRGPIEPTLVTSEREFYELYGQPNLDMPSMHVVARFLRGGSQATVRRVVSDAIAATGEIEGGVDPFLTITAANPGAWGNGITVRINEVDDNDSLYTFTVFEGDEQVETHTVSFEDGDVDGFGQPRYVEDRINGRSKYIVVDHDVSETHSITDGDEIELTDGADDTAPVSDTELLPAIEDFRNVEQVEVNYFMNAGWISVPVQQAMVAVMEYRKDGIVILDMPDTTDVSELVDFRKTESNVASSFAAYYAGWVRILETATGKNVFIPPSGDVAAVFSRSQQQSAIWDAPAGLRRGVVEGVSGVNKIFSENDRDNLYRAGINPIQVFPGQGTVIWGQKTALGFAASLDRINVRFLLNYIRTTAVASLKPFVFQANTEFTRNSIFSLLDNFVGGIQANDGVYGYKIVVDRSNNTDQTIEGNQLLVDVLVQPTRTAEFIRVDTITVPLSQDL